MTKFAFTPNGFKDRIRADYAICEEAASVANSILKVWLSAQPEVFGTDNSEDPISDWSTSRQWDSTHRAVVVNVERLQRAKCKHSTVIYHMGGYVCAECHRSLIPHWEEEK